jgi:hypothetical protein
MEVFHATLSVALHFIGRFFSAERLWPVGPRNCVQFSAWRITAGESRQEATSAQSLVRGWIGQQASPSLANRVF